MRTARRPPTSRPPTPDTPTIGHWRGRRARYRGTRKNLFDLRRVAVVHNLHVTAPPGHDRQLQQAA